MTPILEWLNENALRAYPFRNDSTFQSTSTYVLSNDVIVDGYLVYSTKPVSAGLLSINSTLTTVTFNFTGSVSFAADKTQIFPQYVRNSNGLMVFGSGVINVPVGTWTFSNLLLENTLVYEAWPFVSSVCADNNTTLTGNVFLEEGFQFGIDMPEENLIKFFAGRGYGLPLSCDFSNPNIDDNCADYILKINGVRADENGRLTFEAGQNMQIITDPDNHRIFIGLSFTPDDICPSSPIRPVQTAIDTNFVLDKTLHQNNNGC